MTVRKLKGSAIEPGTITTTQLESSVSQSISAGGGPKIQSLSYPNSNTSSPTVGGDTITLTGSNFDANVGIYINSTAAPSVTRNSSSNVVFTTPALAAGTYLVYAINPNGGFAVHVSGINIA